MGNVGVVAANGDVTAGGKINENSFAGIEATAATAYGVYVDGEVNEYGTINHNSFAGIKSTGNSDDAYAYAYGVYVLMTILLVR